MSTKERYASLKCVDLKKSFNVKGNTINVVNSFNHEFQRGKLYVIKGSSGCGKSTLLSMISLLQECDSGEIKIENKRVDDLSEGEKQKLLLNNIGIVFQDSNLLNGLNIYDNIVLPSMFEKKEDKSDIKKRATSLLSMLNIKHISESYPPQVSGGEKQRAGIARAIMNDPDILICDEPVSSLDEENSKIIIRILSDYCHKENKIVIVTCHSSAFDKDADEIIKMERESV